MSIPKIVLLMTGALMSVNATADSWVLNTELSTISFVSTKKDKIAEVHVFDSFTGTIANGNTLVKIEAASVNTGTEIRDDRMREFLFEITDFPKIIISADSAILDGLSTNNPSMLTTPATLTLHGVTNQVDLAIFATKHSDGSVNIVSQKPIVIKASDYNMEGGIIKLSELVGGINITKAVPVSFSLYFLPN